MIGFLKAVLAWFIFITFVTNVYPDYEPQYLILGTAVILAGAVAYSEK